MALFCLAEAAKLRLDKKRNRRLTKQAEDDSDKEDSPVPRKKAVPPTAGKFQHAYLCCYFMLTLTRVFYMISNSQFCHVAIRYLQT